MSVDSPPSGWRNGKVGDHCILLNGLAFKPEDWTDLGVPIIRIQNLNGSQEFNRYNRTVGPGLLIQPGTLLFSWSGNRGTSFGPHRWPGPTGVLNQHIFKVAPKDGTDPNWFFHALDVVRGRVERTAHGGSGLVHVRRGDLLGYDVPTPPLPEQRRIAEILDTVDEAIRKTEQVIAKLQQMNEGLHHDLLTRGIDDNGELRDPKRHPEQFKNSPLGMVPRQWEVRRLGDLLVKIEQGWSPDCDSLPAPTGSWGVLRTTAVVWEGYQDSENKTLPKTLSPRPKYEVHPNDVLMTRAGPNSRVGVVALVRYTQGRLMLSDKLYRLVPSRPILPAFLVLALSASNTQRHLSALKTGLAESQTNISQDIVRSLRLPAPSLAEQAAIAERHQNLLEMGRTAQLELDKLRTLKHGLMDDLLTGRVRVSVPEEATA
jgi:type I restriction enzyme, S subunit